MYVDLIVIETSLNISQFIVKCNFFSYEEFSVSYNFVELIAHYKCMNPV